MWWAVTSSCLVYTNIQTHNMKRFLLMALSVSLFATSCSKDTLSRIEDNLSSSSGDDHGGGSGSDRGSNISATEVPEAVMTVYQSKYPDATRAEWKKLDTGNYKVQFFVGDAKFETTFTPAGDIVKEERDN